jgi:hypothetical protein
MYSSQQGWLAVLLALTRCSEEQARKVNSVWSLPSEVRSLGEQLAVGDIVGWLATLRKRLVREKAAGLSREVAEALMLQYYGVMPNDEDLRENPRRRRRRR